MSILITGFEPFDNDPENPSRLSARAAVALLKAEGHDAHFLEVPCVFATAFPTVKAEADRVGAEIVITAGLAARRRAVSLESTAKNIIDARIPDNAGGQPRGVPVVPGGPKTLSTRLPIVRAVEAIIAFDPADGDSSDDEHDHQKAFRPGHIPVEISKDAGEYVCNALMYASLAGFPEDMSVGFVHVPLFNAVALEEQAAALAIVAKETLAARIRLRKAAGKCLGA
jgi:pyroglutamyl-peptidase